MNILIEIIRKNQRYKGTFVYKKYILANMNHTKINPLTLWIVRFVQIQLFMTLISFPILVCWGIPLSMLSLLGNLIFSPVLTIFLLLCSLIFFGELIGLPTSLLIRFLEYMSSWWCWLLEWPSNRFIFGFPKPPLYILALIPICILITLFNKQTRTLFISTIIFAILLFLTLLFCSFYKKDRCHTIEVPCNNGHVTLINTKKKLVLVDPGVIGQRISSCSWIEYTLIPHIIKTTGKTRINHIILLQPNKVTFDAIALLCTKIEVKKIYMPLWEGSMKKTGLISFFDLKKAIKNNNVIRITQKPLSFILDNNSSVIIEPLEQKIKKKEINYQACKVTWWLKNNAKNIKSLY